MDNQIKAIEYQNFYNLPDHLYQDNRIPPLFVIYEKPEDYPEHFICRVFVLDHPTPYILKKNRYGEILQALPPGLTFIPADRNDNPNIKGSFI